jgi:hypothetical protein
MSEGEVQTNEREGTERVPMFLSERKRKGKTAGGFYAAQGPLDDVIGLSEFRRHTLILQLTRRVKSARKIIWGFLFLSLFPIFKNWLRYFKKTL